MKDKKIVFKGFIVNGVSYPPEKPPQIFWDDLERAFTPEPKDLLKKAE
ncbi:MAG: hypothetical protein ABFC84_10390 [Veillonellales bacterium]